MGSPTRTGRQADSPLAGTRRLLGTGQPGQSTCAVSIIIYRRNRRHKWIDCRVGNVDGLLSPRREIDSQVGICRILSRNAELYEEMTGELAGEREAFTAHCLDSVNGSMKKKEIIVLKIRALEESRQTVMKKLAVTAGVEPDALTWQTLVELADERALKDRLGLARNRLLTAMNKTDELNRFNRSLIERLMKINYDTAEHLQELVSPEASYGRNGGKSSARLKPGRVVQQTL